MAVPFGFGKGLAAQGYGCCGKPKGCANPTPTCAHLNHPYKRWVLAAMKGQAT